MKFERGVTHVIFFDIEYYVPREHRNGPGLRANPYLDGSFIMGGVFQRYFPIDEKPEKKEEFWIWDMDGEETLEGGKPPEENLPLLQRKLDALGAFRWRPKTDGANRSWVWHNPP